MAYPTNLFTAAGMYKPHPRVYKGTNGKRYMFSVISSLTSVPIHAFESSDAGATWIDLGAGPITQRAEQSDGAARSYFIGVRHPTNADVIAVASIRFNTIPATISVWDFNMTTQTWAGSAYGGQLPIDSDYLMGFETRPGVGDLVVMVYPYPVTDPYRFYRVTPGGTWVGPVTALNTQIKAYNWWYRSMTATADDYVHTALTRINASNLGRLYHVVLDPTNSVTQTFIGNEEDGGGLPQYGGNLGGIAAVGNTLLLTGATRPGNNLLCASFASTGVWSVWNLLAPADAAPDSWYYGPWGFGNALGRIWVFNGAHSALERYSFSGGVLSGPASQTEITDPAIDPEWAGALDGTTGYAVTRSSATTPSYYWEFSLPAANIGPRYRVLP